MNGRPATAQTIRGAGRSARSVPTDAPTTGGQIHGGTLVNQDAAMHSRLVKYEIALTWAGTWRIGASSSTGIENEIRAMCQTRAAPPSRSLSPRDAAASALTPWGLIPRGEAAIGSDSGPGRGHRPSAAILEQAPGGCRGSRRDPKAVAMRPGEDVGRPRRESGRAKARMALARSNARPPDAGRAGPGDRARSRRLSQRIRHSEMEHETGFEPATPTLATSCSTN